MNRTGTKIDKRTFAFLFSLIAVLALATRAPADSAHGARPPATASRTHTGGTAVGCGLKAGHEWELVCLSSVAGYLFDWLVESSVEGSEVGAF